MEGINGSLPEILLTSGATAGGIAGIVWYLIKRVIARIDKLENLITGEDGLKTQMAVNIANDVAFVKRFEDHLDTHKGIKEEVKEMLEKHEEKMERKFKLR